MLFQTTGMTSHIFDLYFCRAPVTCRWKSWLAVWMRKSPMPPRPPRETPSGCKLGWGADLLAKVLLKKSNITVFFPACVTSRSQSLRLKWQARCRRGLMPRRPWRSESWRWFMLRHNAGLGMHLSLTSNNLLKNCERLWEKGPLRG